MIRSPGFAAEPLSRSNIFAPGTGVPSETARPLITPQWSETVTSRRAAIAGVMLTIPCNTSSSPSFAESTQKGSFVRVTIQFEPGGNERKR